MKNRKHSQHGEFHHKHSLGQNFIEDEHLLEQLADLSMVSKEDCVLEIGPGFGALTRPLAARCKEIVSLEIDKTLLPILRVTLEKYQNAQIILGDVMRTDLSKLVEETFGDCSLRVAANLPYYITTDVILKLLSELPQAKSIAVMIQKEVGDKLLSRPGEEGYGPLALTCQYLCDVQRALDVPAACFNPPPKVDSSFMLLVRRENPLYPVKDEKTFFKLIKGAFVMRRKTLVNNLMSAFSMSRDVAVACVESVGLSAQVRAEALSMEQFSALADAIFAMQSSGNMV